MSKNIHNKNLSHKSEDWHITIKPSYVISVIVSFAITIFVAAIAIIFWVISQFSSLSDKLENSQKNIIEQEDAKFGKILDQGNDKFGKVIQGMEVIKERTQLIQEIVLKSSAENLKNDKADLSSLNPDNFSKNSIQLSPSDYHAAIEILKTQPLERAKEELVEKKLFSEEQIKNIFQPAIQNSPNTVTADFR